MKRFVVEIDTEPLPLEPRGAVIQHMQEQFDEFERRMRSGDQLWRFREEKHADR